MSRNTNLKSNAAFIARACNSHDELLEALEAVIEYADDAVRTIEAEHPGLSVAERFTMNRARAVIAKAKGEAC